MSGRTEDRVDAALAQLQRWQAPAGFAARVAGLALAPRVGGDVRIALALRAAGIAATVSVVVWLGAETLYVGLVSLAESGGLGHLGPVVGAAALVAAWKIARRRPFRA